MFLYVIRLKTLICCFAVFVAVFVGIGIAKLYEDGNTVTQTLSDKSPHSDIPALSSASTLPQNDEIELPILMYHSILKSPKRSGSYIISCAAFEEDLRFIKENGFTPIHINQLADFVYKGTPLPQKPIVLTFDDGYFNNYTYAYPQLKKYNFKAVISIIGYYTDLYSKNPDENPGYSHITWDNICEMQNSGLIEFQNHSYNMHTTDKGRNGTKKIKGETDEHYKKLLTADLGKLQDAFKKNTGTTPLAFTYPFGSVSNASFDIIKEMGFKASLCSESGLNKITRDPQCLYMLKRYLRTPEKSASKILSK